MDQFLFNARLAAWLKATQEMSDIHYANYFPSLTPARLVLERGRRYIRVTITEANGSRSAHSFIDMTNGNVLKARNWKSPTPRLVLGNLLDDTGGLSNTSGHGVGRRPIGISRLPAKLKGESQ